MSSNPAKYYTQMPDGAVGCSLCPRHCVISPGGTGWCKVRCNEGGELLSIAYGRPAAVAIDPIEKKPLMRFLPGSQTFSLGTFGCNFDCCFCQNSSLSNGVYNAHGDWRVLAPHEAVSLALMNGCASISFTYNEPTVWIEYAMEIATLARNAGLKTVLVSNGFIQPGPAREFYPLIDAANIDVKGFSDDFYQSMCNGLLEPVKTACEILKNEAGAHLELTNLVIPGRNDAPEMLEAYLDWVEGVLGLDTPLHFNAYFPAYHYRQSPRTPVSLLRAFCDRARERGFLFVQMGNV